MRKLITIVVCIIVFLLVIALVIDLPKTGVVMVSENIEYSKKIGVFIDEYIPSKEVISIGNKKTRVSESWIEKSWSYKDVWKSIQIIEDTMFYISTKEPIDFVLNDEVKIENDVIGYKHGKLSCTIKSASPDSIVLNDEKGERILFLRKLN